MKRILSILLTLLLMVSLVPWSARAAGTPTVSISSGEVQPGGEVTLTVSIKDNPGIASYRFYLYYDITAFSLDISSGIALQGAFKAEGSYLGNATVNAKENPRYDGDKSKDGVLLLWYNSRGENTDSDGDIAKITFRTNSSVGNGVYPFEISSTSRDCGDKNGKDILLELSSGDITVTGSSFEKPATPTTPTKPSTPATGEKPVFTDVAGNWAEEYIMRAYESGLVEGYGAGKYGPNEQMTRAQFVTILWRAMGEPTPAKAASFKDLDPRQAWYHSAVAWAEENEVVNGVGNGKFDPNGAVTREQIAAILHRLAGEPMGMEMMFTSLYDKQYPDSDKVGAWAKQALYWSIYNEIYCGEASVNVGGKLAPRANANRAQIAVMIVRYLDMQK